MNWIKCSVMIPSPEICTWSNRYLICSDNSVEFAYFQIKDNRPYWTLEGSDAHVVPTHWMDIPDLPKE